MKLYTAISLRTRKSVDEMSLEIESKFSKLDLVKCFTTLNDLERYLSKPNDDLESEKRTLKTPEIVIIRLELEVDCQNIKELEDNYVSSKLDGLTGIFLGKEPLVPMYLCPKPLCPKPLSNLKGGGTKDFKLCSATYTSHNEAITIDFQNPPHSKSGCTIS